MYFSIPRDTFDAHDRVHENDGFTVFGDKDEMSGRTDAPRVRLPRRRLLIT